MKSPQIYYSGTQGGYYTTNYTSFNEIAPIDNYYSCYNNNYTYKPPTMNEEKFEFNNQNHFQEFDPNQNIKQDIQQETQYNDQGGPSLNVKDEGTGKWN